jgi:ribonucleotide reductase alpha subunit
MPALKNARHERFAQELAKGAAASHAYAAAGYKPSDQAASRMTRNIKVAARIEELKERAAERTVVTVANLTDRLLKIAEKGEASTEAPMLSVARASIMDAAKLNGLVIDRTQRELSEEQLKAVLEMVAAQPGAAEQLLARLT